MKKHLMSIFLTITVLFSGAVLAAEVPVLLKDGHRIARFLKTADFGTNVLAKSVLGEASKREVLQANFNGTIADGSTTKKLIIPGRAGTVKGIDGGALVLPVGGTNTLKVEKIVAGTPTTLLNAATFDPTTFSAAGTSQALTLSSTSASLSFTAADMLLVTLTAGTQTTDAQDVGVGVEVEYNDTP